WPRKPQHVARFLDGQSAEQVEMCDLRGCVVFRSEPDQNLVQRQEQFGILSEGAYLVEQFEPDAIAAALDPASRSGAFNQNPPHGLGCRREEMPPAIPALGLIRVHQPQIYLVDERGGLERLTRLLLGQPLGGELPQLVVDQ